jgi:hypothetical protein
MKFQSNQTKKEIKMYKEKKLQDKEVVDNVLRISTLLNGREVAEILKISRGNKLVKSSYHRDDTTIIPYIFVRRRGENIIPDNYMACSVF